MGGKWPWRVEVVTAAASGSKAAVTSTISGQNRDTRRQTDRQISRQSRLPQQSTLPPPRPAQASPPSLLKRTRNLEARELSGLTVVNEVRQNARELLEHNDEVLAASTHLLWQCDRQDLFLPSLNDARHG